MGLLSLYLDWSFLAVAFGIYGATQVLLGIIFIGDSWQTPTGWKSRLKKVAEIAIPLILGLAIGYFFDIGPETVAKEADNRAVYFSFAGGVSSLVHAAIETSFPSFVSQALSNIRAAIGGTTPRSPTPPPHSSDKKDEE